MVLSVTTCSTYAARFLLLVFLALNFSSCGPAPRSVPPVITIIVLDDWDHYLLDGQRINRRTLDSRLQHRADNYRRSITGTSRAYVRLSSRSNNSDTLREKKNIMNYCMKIGLDKITMR